MIRATCHYFILFDCSCDKWLRGDGGTGGEGIKMEREKTAEDQARRTIKKTNDVDRGRTQAGMWLRRRMTARDAACLRNSHILQKHR